VHRPENLTVFAPDIPSSLRWSQIIADRKDPDIFESLCAERFSCSRHAIVGWNLDFQEICLVGDCIIIYNGYLIGERIKEIQ
jgi:hypothetical protein